MHVLKSGSQKSEEKVCVVEELNKALLGRSIIVEFCFYCTLCQHCPWVLPIQAVFQGFRSSKREKTEAWCPKLSNETDTSTCSYMSPSTCETVGCEEVPIKPCRHSSPHLKHIYSPSGWANHIQAITYLYEYWKQVAWRVNNINKEMSATDHLHGVLHE